MQHVAGVVLEIAGREVAADHAERRVGIVVEQSVVDAVDHDDRRVDEQVDPLRIFVRTENDVEGHRRGAGIGDGEVELERGGVIGLGLEDGVDDRVDVGVAVLEARDAAVVRAEPGHRVHVAGRRAGG